MLLEAYFATHAHLAHNKHPYSVPLMQDTTRARARKYGKDAGLSPSGTHVNEVGVVISIRDPYTSVKIRSLSSMSTHETVIGK